MVVSRWMARWNAPNQTPQVFVRLGELVWLRCITWIYKLYLLNNIISYWCSSLEKWRIISIWSRLYFVRREWFIFLVLRSCRTFDDSASGAVKNREIDRSIIQVFGILTKLKETVDRPEVCEKLDQALSIIQCSDLYTPAEISVRGSSIANSVK